MINFKTEDLKGDLFGGVTAGVVALPLGACFRRGVWSRANRGSLRCHFCRLLCLAVRWHRARRSQGQLARWW
jgi:hypothetical protein